MRVLFVFLKYTIILMQNDEEFRELFDQLSSETVMDGYINFDIEVIASLSAINPLIVKGDKKLALKISQKL